MLFRDNEYMLRCLRIKVTECKRHIIFVYLC